MKSRLFFQQIILQEQDPCQLSYVKFGRQMQIMGFIEAQQEGVPGSFFKRYRLLWSIAPTVKLAQTGKSG